jgi:glycerophosphoryl diester phosphodiesterase
LNLQVRPLLQHLRQCWRPIVVVHVVFTVLGALILMPAFGLLLQSALWLSGSSAVVDQEIAGLLLSPMGFAGGVILLAMLLAITGLELGAQVLVAHAHYRGHTAPVRAILRYTLARAPRLLELTLRLTLRILAYLLPCLAAVGIAALALLTEYDINYYLTEKPREFYLVLAVALACGLPTLWLLGKRLLDWSQSLPLLILADEPANTALPASSALVDGNRSFCVALLLGWLLVAVLLLAVPAMVLNLGMDVILAQSGSSLTALVVLIGLLGAVWSLLNLLAGALALGGLTLTITGLAHRLSPRMAEAAPLRAVETPMEGRRWRWISVWSIAALVVVLALGLLPLILREPGLDSEVLVVAHRGAAGAAPENTLAAIEQAIADGADWVEIDVQESRDGTVVVVHDSDFMKLAGDPIKVWEGDLDRLQDIDVGSWFDPRFADQRVPTLAEVLQVIKAADARLVIELKYYGHDQQLEQRVVEAVEAAGIADRVAIMSLKLAGVQKLKQQRPGWTGGLLAATAIGDITRLEADFLAVNQSMASRRFIERARAAGKQVFVWTVNDGLSLNHWMSMGVDGVITDEPALARSILEQRRDLTAAERLLLSATLFFGKPEALRKYRDNSP